MSFQAASFPCPSSATDGFLMFPLACVSMQLPGSSHYPQRWHSPFNHVLPYHVHHIQSLQLMWDVTLPSRIVRSVLKLKLEPSVSLSDSLEHHKPARNSLCFGHASYLLSQTSLRNSNKSPSITPFLIILENNSTMQIFFCRIMNSVSFVQSARMESTIVILS